MGIQIKRIDEGYMVEASGSDTVGSWAMDTPLGVRAIVEKLLSLGWHQTDIGDAFYAADPGWIGRRDNTA